MIFFFFFFFQYQYIIPCGICLKRGIEHCFADPSVISKYQFCAKDLVLLVFESLQADISVLTCMCGKQNFPPTMWRVKLQFGAFKEFSDRFYINVITLFPTVLLIEKYVGIMFIQKLCY